MKKSGLFIVTTFIIMSCGNETATNQQQGETTEVAETVELEKTTDKSIDFPEDFTTVFLDISLDEGKKWKINEEMKPFILEEEKILDEYITSNSEDFLELATQLKEKNSQLIYSCTMKGESHNQLHNWLNPHVELLAFLEQSETVEEATPIIETLVASFARFYVYFE